MEKYAINDKSLVLKYTVNFIGSSINDPFWLTSILIRLYWHFLKF